ncbi:hypothetical protein LPJ64_006226 [Coemansia asiatica]|uniref:Uncharacterized protein n=1 Tax=Coemansia asiatica TaxID=1052880 RepID=A0A9W8CGW5_9FUNG|nr:hypothetical protein LPJ64_006226 [Coemansia asiatica]
MTVAQPFPVLASADNSRSASPALSSGSPSAGASSSGQRNGNSNSNSNGKGKGKGKVHSNFKPAQAASSKPRHKKQQQQQQKPASVSTSTPPSTADQRSETNTNANARTRTSTSTSTSTSIGTSIGGSSQQNQQEQRSNNNGKHKNKNKKAQPGPKPTPVAVANEQQPSGKENIEARASDAGLGAPKPAGRQKKPRAPTASAGEEASKKQSKTSRRRTVASVEANKSKQFQPSVAGTSATQTFAPTASVEQHFPESAPLVRSSSSGVLPMAMIVPGENGRARVLFNPQAMDNDHPLASATPSPRFSSSSVQSARGQSSGAYLASRARFPAHYGDNLGLGLGLRSPMSPALPSAPVNGSFNNSRSVTMSSASMAGGQSSHAAPPMVRHRSLTSTQLRPTTRSFSPQSQHNQHQYQNQNQQYHFNHNHNHYQQQQQQHQYQQQQHHHYQPQQQPMRRLSSASSAGYDNSTALPLSAPAGGSLNARGRSQSVSTHINMTGLRISMAQSRPGNVLAPHLPLLSRASSGGAVQPNAYANGGYFATRRASVSNVGLAVDPSHSIRIPTIMFQKPKPEDLAKAASAAASAAGALPSSQPSSETATAGPQSTAAAEPVSVPAAARPLEASDLLATPVTGGSNSSDLMNITGLDEPSAGEALAMQRLQEMISSMRALTQPQSQTQKTTTKTHTQQTPAQAQLQQVPSAKLADVDMTTSAAAIQMPPTPAAHPTSRFDSILEEDEDDEADEEILDAEAAEDSSVTASSHHDSSDATGYSSGAACAPALFAA